METHDYSFEELLKADKLFSDAIENDGWILYHATTSIAEDDIERNGIRCMPGNNDDVLKVVKLFRAMNWPGEDMAGYSVLRSFSLHRSGVPLLYFREQSTRSLVYGEKDWAGGETVRALHHALADLRNFLQNASVGERHYTAQLEHCKGLVQRNRCPSHVIRVDNDWLRAELDALAPVFDRVTRKREAYRYGLVYAVKFEPDTLPNFWNNHGQGVICSAAVRPAQLVGKARLYLGDHSAPRTDSIERLLEIHKRRGIISSLKEPPRPQSWSPSADEYSERERALNVDSFAGRDEAIDVTLQWGTPELKQLARTGKLAFNMYCY